MSILDSLNSGQKETVQTIDGPVLVLAGAGSGKTKSLTHRVAYLIEKGVNPENILAITFTNKAAGEIKTRVESLIRKSKLEVRNMPTMGTFHSICAKILRKEIEIIGLPKSYVIFDEYDSKKVIKNCLKKLGLDEKKITPASIKYKISSAKNELINAAEYKRIADDYNSDIIFRIYEQYQKELIDNGALDFDDLIFFVVKIFQKSPEILEKYQNLWRYILIDE